MVVAESNDKMIHVEEMHSNTTSAVTAVAGSSNDAEEAFTCTQCEETFQDRDTLFRHVKEFHQQHMRERRAFRCDVCMRSFKSLTGLKNHTRTHPIFYETAHEMASQLLSTSILQESFSPTVTSTQVQSSTDSDTKCTDLSWNISPTEADTTSNVTFTLSSCGGMDENVTFTTVSSHRGMDDATFTLSSHGGMDDATFILPSQGGMDENSAMDIEDNIITSVTSVNDNDAEKNEQNGVIENTRKRLSQRRQSGIPIRIQHSKTETNAVYSLFHKDDTIGEVSVLVESKSILRTEDHCSNNSTEGKQPRRITRLGSKLSRTRHSSNQRPPSVKCRTPKRRHQIAVPKKNKKSLNIASPFAKTLSRKISSPVISLDTQHIPVSIKRTPGGIQRTPVRSCTTSTGAKSVSLSGNSNEQEKATHMCRKCGKSFLDKAKLEVHFTVHARETPEKCGIPKQTLKRNLERAEFSHASKKTLRPDDSYPCRQCGRVYDKQKYLDAHLKVHDVNTPYSCSFCDKKFRYQSSLRAHSYVHQGETREHVQGFETDKKHDMTLKNTLTSGRYQKWNTTNIFSLLTSAESLDTDLIDLPYTCKMCTYTSRDPASLLVHMKTHTRTGPFTCKHCDKSYKLQSNLRTHEKIHTVNKLKDFLIGKQATRKQ